MLRSLPRALFSLATVLVLTAALPARADWIGESQGDYEDRSLSLTGEKSRVLFPLEGGGRVLPTRVAASGPAGGFAATLPERAPVVDVSRIDLSGTEVTDTLLGKPLPAYLRPRYQVGTVLRAGSDGLFIALDPSIGPEQAQALLSRPLAMMSKTPLDRETVVLALPAMTPGVDGRPAIQGEPIGAVYDAGDHLLLSPPRSLFFGLKPLFD